MGTIFRHGQIKQYPLIKELRQNRKLIFEVVWLEMTKIQICNCLMDAIHGQKWELTIHIKKISGLGRSSLWVLGYRRSKAGKGMPVKHHY